MAEHDDSEPGSAPDTDSTQTSKSAAKRAMTALQDIGAQLVQLSDRELSRMPIEDEALATAIVQARSIRSNSARRRQLQYIGKLMRRIDAGPLTRALEDLHHQKYRQTDAFHHLEKLRDRLLEDGDGAIEDVVKAYPETDRQHLRQLLRQHRREVAQARPPAAARKIFRYLRELSD